jgi:nicotinate-nucleotide--dimethylbenzimidazole phosphoribosyltransferase
MSLLETTLAAIRPVDRALAPRVQAHLDNLTKPPGSLGRLEETALRYCLATGTDRPRLGAKTIFTFAGDHGVADAGVSAFPKEVTPQMVMNMLAGDAAVNVLGRHAGTTVRVVDVGVADPLAPAGPELIRRKVRSGTANIAEGPAMSVDEARRALEVGIELAAAAAAEGTGLLGTGDMGIANTTPSSALFAALLPCDVAAVTGRGTGIDDARLACKIGVIRRALEVNRERMSTPLETLAAVGGLEIAAIAGVCLGGAAARVPVVVDGFISSAGALVACRMKPEVVDCLFFSHMSAEAGHRAFFEKFGANPLLDLGLRLGEGTGAALAMILIEAAVKIYNEMATFGSAGVSGRGA